MGGVRFEGEPAENYDGAESKKIVENENNCNSSTVQKIIFLSFFDNKIYVCQRNHNNYSF